MKLAEVKENYEYRESRFRIDVAMAVIVCCLATLMFLRFGSFRAAVILEVGLGIILIINLFYRWNALKDIKQIMELLEKEEKVLKRKEEKKDDR